MFRRDERRKASGGGVTTALQKAFSGRVVVNALISVPLGLLICAVVLILLSLLLNESSSEEGPNLLDSARTFGLYFLVAVHIGYLAALLIGAPIHYLLVKTQKNNLLGYIFGGAIASMILIALWIVPGFAHGVQVTADELAGISFFYGVPPIVIAAVFGVLTSRSERVSDASYR
jgi:hypothetical protein